MLLGLTPEAQSIKEKPNKLDLIKIKDFCSEKDAVKKMKRQAKDWEKILENHISDKVHLYRVFIKKSQNSSIRKQCNLKMGE